MRRMAAITLLALVLFGATSCSRRQETPNLEEQVLIGEQIEVNVGQTLEISQRGQPVQGFMWEIETPPSEILEQIGELVVELDSDDINAEGTFTYTFRAVAAGTTYIKMIYHQPFEDDPPSGIYEATVIVSP